MRDHNQFSVHIRLKLDAPFLHSFSVMHYRMYADSKYWLPLAPAVIQDIYEAAAKEHVMTALRKEHKLASTQPRRKSICLDSSHPPPDPENPSDAELLSSGFVVLLGTPPGKPTACALNPQLNVPQWLGALERMYKKCEDELDALAAARDVSPFASHSEWWKGFLEGVLKPKIELLSSLTLDIPQWSLPRPGGLMSRQESTTEEGDPHLKDAREHLHGQTYLTIDKKELKRRHRINDQAEDLLRERDILEIGTSIYIRTVTYA